MKKVALVVLVLVMFGCTGNVKKTSKQIIGIEPGIGCDKIRIGMSLNDVTGVLGENYNKISYDQEYQNYYSYKYIPEKNLVFNIGFDYLIEYIASSNSTGIPAWKLYFKNDQLVYIVFSKFIYPTVPEKYNGIRPIAIFENYKEDLIKVMGNDNFYFKDKYNNEHHFYLEQGVDVILVRSKIMVFHIFEGLSKKRAEEIISIMTGSSNNI